MKCPLLTLGALNLYGNTDGKTPNCLKEECAWWVDELNQCSMPIMAIQIGYVRLELAAIAKELSRLK